MILSRVQYKGLVYLSGFFYNCRRLPETKRHFYLILHVPGSKFLVAVAACTPSIHVFLGRPLFLLSCGIHSIINFGILSSGILWMYHTIVAIVFFSYRLTFHSRYFLYMFIFYSFHP